VCAYHLTLWEMRAADCSSSVLFAPELFCFDSSEPKNKEEPRSVKLSLSADGLRTFAFR
jgi:hypothetical protein